MLKRKLKPNIGLKSIIFLGICAILLTADLVTKHFEEAMSWNVDIIHGWVEISNNIRNPGCAFSFLSENPDIGQPVLISFTFLLLAVLAFGYIFIPERFTVLKLAMAIIIAGAIGNLVDRFAFWEVRDFIGLNMMFNGRLVYCNLADFWIVIGAVLVVVDLLFFNEYSVFPLTKKARAAQSKRKREEDEIDSTVDDGFDDVEDGDNG